MLMGDRWRGCRMRISARRREIYRLCQQRSRTVFHKLISQSPYDFSCNYALSANAIAMPGSKVLSVISRKIHPFHILIPQRAELG